MKGVSVFRRDLLRIGRGCQLGLNACARLPQVNRVGSHVSGLEHPVLPKRMLYCQVPLLGVRGLEVAGHRQHKQELRGDQPRATVCTGIVRKLARVRQVRDRIERETLQRTEAGHEIGVEHASFWQSFTPVRKKLDKPPGPPPPKAMGRYGAWNDSWSTVPTSSRTK